MSKKCRAYSESGLGLAPADNRKAFYAGFEAALRERLAQPEQEPVTLRIDRLNQWLDASLKDRKPAREQPAQRKPLTDERICQIIEGCKITLVNYCSDDKQIEFARAIEAAHGIK